MASSSSSAPSAQKDAAAKLHTGLEHKSAGNAAFTRGDIKSALCSYHHAVLYLSGLESRSILGLVGENSGREGKPEDLSSDEEDDAGPAQSAQVGVQSEKELSLVYSNMAACYLKQKNYKRAVEAAEKSLKCDSSNVKAKYRKAQAMRLAGDVYAAQKFLGESIEGLKKSKKGKGKEEVLDSFEAESKVIERLIEQKEAMAKNRWKGFLGKNPQVLNVDSAKVVEGDGKVKEDQALTATKEDA